MKRTRNSIKVGDMVRPLYDHPYLGITEKSTGTVLSIAPYYLYNSSEMEVKFDGKRYTLVFLEEELRKA